MRVHATSHACGIHPIRIIAYNFSFVIMAILSRTYASSNILQEDSEPMKPTPITTALILRESSPLSPTQACYPGKLKLSKCKSSLLRKTLKSYLKKTRQGRELLCRIREQRPIPQVSSLRKLGPEFAILMIQFPVIEGSRIKCLVNRYIHLYHHLLIRGLDSQVD
jgi:hypothetical protein